MVSFNSGNFSFGSQSPFGMTPTMAAMLGMNSPNPLGLPTTTDTSRSNLLPTISNPLGISPPGNMSVFPQNSGSTALATQSMPGNATASTSASSYNDMVATIVPIFARLMAALMQNASAQGSLNNTANQSIVPSSNNNQPAANGESNNNAISPSPVAPAPATDSSQSAKPPAPAPADAGTGKVSTGTVSGGGPKELVLKNTDSKPMTIALFENTGPGMNPNINDPNNKFVVQPGETLKLAMPDSWQGRAQKLSGKADDPATWAEINFEKGKDGGKDTIWYDNSVIRGYNAAVTMAPTNSTDPSQIGGSSKSIIDNAPPDAVTTDSGGNKVIKDPETYTGTLNTAAIDYLNSAIGNKNVYVRNFDHDAVRTSQDSSLTVTFGAP